MQSIRELHKNDADILNHRKHHLAETFGLRFRAAAKLNLVEFADPVHKQRNFAAKSLGNVIERRRCVFDRVVKNGRRDGRRIQVHFGEFLSDCDRMRYVGLAGFSGLARMRLRAKFISGGYLLQLLFGQIRLQRFYQPTQAMVALIRARQF